MGGGQLESYNDILYAGTGGILQSQIGSYYLTSQYLIKCSKVCAKSIALRENESGCEWVNKSKELHLNFDNFTISLQKVIQ